MKRSTVVGWVLLVVLPVAAAITQMPEAELPPLTTYHVKRVTRPITIDGHLVDSEWTGAQAVKLTYWWPEQTGPKQDTFVRLLWDDTALYAAFECTDVDITAVHTEHDDPTYRDDCAELFLQPDPKRKPTAYIGLEMSARAVLYDYFNSNGVALLRRFDLLGVQLATQLTGTLNARGDQDTKWTLEVKIPFENFDDLTRALPPEPGSQWRCQMNRWDGTAPDRALALWTHSGMKGPNPHNPERFGYLEFDAAEATD